MSEVTLFGPHWSAYTRTVRLTLEEKAVDYELLEVDFASGEMPSDQLSRHPFGKVPALDHRGFLIYETSAICRYVDAAFDGVSLQPRPPHQLGRMAQIVAILDAYLSYEIRMGYFTEVAIKPLIGLSSDSARFEQATQAIKKGFAAMADCCAADGPFLVGEQLSLADLHASPLFDFLEQTPHGMDLVHHHEVLRQWWDVMAKRASMSATAIDINVFRDSS